MVVSYFTTILLHVADFLVVLILRSSSLSPGCVYVLLSSTKSR